MRIIIQVVKNASITIDGHLKEKIGRGFLLLTGFKEGDDKIVANKLIEKLLKLRIFHDEQGKTNLSLKDVDGEILSISQFTLYGSLKDGNRPSFTHALKFADAKLLYSYFFETLRTLYPKSYDGLFGADMEVELINDGPSTYILDSEDFR